MTPRERIEQRISDPEKFLEACRELKTLLIAEPSLANYHFAHRLLDDCAWGRQVRVALLTSYTSNFVPPLLKAELMLSSIHAEIYSPPHHNQFRQEILNPRSGLYTFNPDVTLVGFNLEDVFSDGISQFSALTETERGVLASQILELCGAVAAGFRRNATANAHLLIQDFVPPWGFYEPLAANGEGMRAFVESINKGLRRLASEFTGVHVADYGGLANGCGLRSWVDPRLYAAAGIPVAQQHWISLANWYGTYVRAALNAEVKCIVLDLDNTLWGGILGEDGYDGIQIGGGYPGNVFRRFQEYLAGLHAAGYILAISSKNNRDDVMDVLRRHPGMALRERHFAAIKANWNPKSQNIRDLSREVQLSCDQMLFVDDNPVEIAEVRSAIPEMACMQLASPPLDFVRQLEAQRCLGRLLVTEEDRQRGRQYFEDRQRREFRDAAATLNEFYRSLKQRVTVYVNHPPHTARIAQLSQRTNQFNMAALRLTEAEVERMMTDRSAMLITADLSDAFGDSGIIAFIQIRKCARDWSIENWLMSCRVLGRTIEDALLDYVIRQARVEGVGTIFSTYMPTKKNTPFGDFYARRGFEEIEARAEGEKRYALRVADWREEQKDVFVEIAEKVEKVEELKANNYLTH